jgi:hypothetical protein
MACISGITLGGFYEYINCCGIKTNGFATSLQTVCIDAAYSSTTVGISANTASTCSIDCNLGPLDYSFSVTGTCYSSSGTAIIDVYNGTPIYTINNEIPGGIPSQTGLGPFTFSGLSADTYTFRINDSSGGVNEDIYVNVIISGCFRASLYGVSGTTCGLDNGSFYVSATTSSSPYNLLLYKDGSLYDVVTTPTQPYQFTNLSSGVYYVNFVDFGNVTATTGNGVVIPSTGVDFGLWKVNTSNCVIDKGKLAVTGVTGTAPFTYLWSNGETTQLITGLTQGSYSCTVTDNLGCSTTKYETIGVADPIGLGLVTSLPPSCFMSDGTITYTLTGGTAPFYYSANTGQIGYTLSDTFIITGLTNGNYTTVVRDANFCEFTLNDFLITPNGFNVVNTTITNSNCSQNNGQIQVNLSGGYNIYNYYLSGQTSGIVNVETGPFLSYTSPLLVNDNYLLVISASSSNCVYSNVINVTSQQKFTISATTTGSTCGYNNGVLEIQVGSGYTGFLDYVVSGVPPIIDSTLSSYTFTNLYAGSYNITVTDQSGCSVTEQVIISTSGSLLSTISTTTCTGSGDGTATVNIFDGLPPISYSWSNNVPGVQTGSTVTGLTAGTYSVLVSDSNGCFKNHSFILNCNSNLVTSYDIYTLCKNTFVTTTGNQRGFLEMLNEGYLDLTSGYTGCVFSGAIFTAEVNINGSAFTQSFYTATTLNDVPQDTLWQSTIESILSGITEVGSYTINLLNNTLQIKSNCSGDFDPLADAPFSLGLEIVYDVICDSTPTPPPILCGMSGYTFEINQP